MGEDYSCRETNITLVGGGLFFDIGGATAIASMTGHPSAATSILALAGGNLVLGTGGGKYRCFGLAVTIIAIDSLAAADSFPL